jgi:hypothetical protein
MKSEKLTEAGGMFSHWWVWTALRINAPVGCFHMVERCHRESQTWKEKRPLHLWGLPAGESAKEFCLVHKEIWYKELAPTASGNRQAEDQVKCWGSPCQSPKAWEPGKLMVSVPTWKPEDSMTQEELSFSSDPKARKDWYPRSNSQSGGAPHTLERVSLFVPYWPSTDWTKPTEHHLLCSVYQLKCSSHPKTPSNNLE